MLRAPLLAIAGLLTIVSVQSVSASTPGFENCLSVPIQGATLSGVELDHWLAATSARLDGAARSIAPELGGTGGCLLSGAFGGGGLRGGRTDTPAPTLLAEWLEIEIIVGVDPSPAYLARELHRWRATLPVVMS